METIEEDKEEEGEGDEGEAEDKQSMLKLFFMATEDEDKSSWTPKSLSPPTAVALKVVQVLELWPMFPQCEHFLPISLQTKLNFSDQQPTPQR